MRRSVAVIGPGQLGALFGMGMLRLGRPVFPWLRGDRLSELTDLDPEAVLVTVAETDLDGVLRAMPPALADRLVLLQNDLGPEDWTRHGLPTPTVAVVWFEKKAGRPLTVIRPTPVAGPLAPLVLEALRAIDVPGVQVGPEALAFELARKSLYILGSNLMGLAVGGTTSGLVHAHPEDTRALLRDVLSLERLRLAPAMPRGLAPRDALPEETLLAAVFEDFLADPDHGCVGRSAPRRLALALARADAAGLEVPSLRRLGLSVASRPKPPS